MVLVLNSPFFHLFILGNIEQKSVFHDILKRQNAFLALKTRNLKSGKIEVFSKGLVYGFGPKLTIFPCFYFRKYRPRKCVLQFSRTKERFSRL